MNAIRKPRPVRFVKPDFSSIFKKAEREHKELDEMFQLLGWSDLPVSLKLAIEDDVIGYMDELTGRFSTNCAAVQRRRESVDFWVKSYLNNLCSLETAAESLKVNPL